MSLEILLILRINAYSWQEIDLWKRKFFISYVWVILYFLNSEFLIK